MRIRSPTSGARHSLRNNHCRTAERVSPYTTPITAATRAVNAIAGVATTEEEIEAELKGLVDVRNQKPGAGA